MRKLRPYQEEAVAAAFAVWDSGTQATCISLPTGMGKTVVFAEVARQWRIRHASRVVVIAHRGELIRQAADAIERATGDAPQLEIASERARVHSNDPVQVTVASVQSLCRASRLERFDPTRYGLLIVDEGHHCVPQNSTYWAVLQHFQQNTDLKVLLVSATFDRADKLAIGQVAESVCYEKTLLDAIDGGWLCRPHQRFVTDIKLDFSKCRTTAGDINAGDLSAVMNEDDTAHQVAAAIVEIAGPRKTLIFGVDVSHAQAIAGWINNPPADSTIPKFDRVEAYCIHGGTEQDERERRLKEFADGQFRFLVGCAIFTEGFDDPGIEVVAVARPTKSRALYTQMVGRGTRTLPGVLTPEMNDADASVRLEAIAKSVKPFCEVIDFVGNSGRHKLISTADLLAGRHAPAAVLRAIESAKGRAVDMREEIEKAAEDIEREEREKQERKERREREERERMEEARRRLEERKAARAKATFEMVDVDPFGFERRAQRENGSRDKTLASPDQVAFLERHRIDASKMSAKEAASVIGDMKRRWKLGLCSAKQEDTLRKNGEHGSISKVKASVLFQILKARGWKKRDYRLTRDRWAIRQMDGQYAPVVKDPAAGPVVLDARFPTEGECRNWISGVMEHDEAMAA